MSSCIPTRCSSGGFFPHSPGRVWRAALFGALTLAVSSSGVAANTNALTLREAQTLAVDRSRQLSAQDAAVSASRAMAAAAGQLPDPTLRLGVDNLPVNGSDAFSLTRDFMTMRRIGVMQEFTRSAKRELRAQRFEREADKSLAEKSATVAVIQRDTALAWLDRYFAQAAAAIIAEQSTQASAEVDVAEAAYRAGRGNQADILAARSVLVAFADRASEFDRRIRTAKVNLARWVGDQAEAPLADAPDTSSIRLDTDRLDTDALEAHLLGHPELLVLARQEEIAATEASLAQANKKPDWSVEVAYSQRGPAYSNMISIGVSVPLQWDQKNRQDREVAAKLAAVDQARARQEEALRAHVAEVRTMIAEWQSGRERQQRYQRELLPLARARTQALIAAYRGGKSPLAEVLLARRNEIEVRMQALQLESDTARLWAQLNFLFPDGDATYPSIPVTFTRQGQPQ